MSVFFTSDQHISHRFVAHLRGFVPTDGPETVCLKGIQKHDDTLAERWDQVIGPRDDVWVLGDISAGGTRAQRNALTWFDGRPGRKHLITGNHDGCHPMHRDSHIWAKEYLVVFSSVQAFARRKIAGFPVLLSHLPYYGAGEGEREIEERFGQYRLPDEGLWLLHGHLHSRHKRISGPHYEKSIHVGVDAHDFTPVSLDAIASIIAAQEDSQ